MRQLAVLTLFVCLCVSTFADNPTSMVWSTYLGGNDEDINQDLVADANDSSMALRDTYSIAIGVTLAAAIAAAAGAALWLELKDPTKAPPPQM